MRGSMTRRSVLAGAAYVAGSSLTTRALAQVARPTTVGFHLRCYPQRLWLNQAHAVAARRIAALPGVKLVEQERGPETAEVSGYGEHDPARWRQGPVPTSSGSGRSSRRSRRNIQTCCRSRGRPVEGGRCKKHYRLSRLHGGTALSVRHRGRDDNQNRQARLYGSKPLSFVFNNCNGFVLGARSVRPDATCQVVITGDWDNPVKEAETVNALVDQGVDVIVANVNSPKVAVETAERRGIMSCGYHTDLSALAPTGFLDVVDRDPDAVCLVRAALCLLRLCRRQDPAGVCHQAGRGRRHHAQSRAKPTTSSSLGINRRPRPTIRRRCFTMIVSTCCSISASSAATTRERARQCMERNGSGRRRRPSPRHPGRPTDGFTR